MGETQNIYGLGLTLAFTPGHLGPIRFSVPFSHGLEYRTEPPHQGLDIYFSVGGEIGIWIAPYVQLAGSASRIFAMPTGTRNQVNLRLIVGWKDNQ